MARELAIVLSLGYTDYSMMPVIIGKANPPKNNSNQRKNLMYRKESKNGIGSAASIASRDTSMDIFRAFGEL